MMQLGQLQSCDTEKRKIMDFNEIYKQKLTTADEAVKVIRSGDWIDYGWCTGTVDALDRHLQSVCLNFQTSTSAAVFL